MPAITSPVSRFANVADAERSAAFYRDRLGFDVTRTAEGLDVSSGPAELHFTVAASPAPEIFFFEVSDAPALHAEMLARGAAPTVISRVNWIKMEMFEIRDPDGHTLWFGQSFDKPCNHPVTPMFLQALPELPWNDVEAGVAYYRDVLGFHINYQQHDLGVMDRDKVTLLLVARTPKHTGIASAYLYIENADRLFAELRTQGAIILKEPVSHPWGLREFHVADPEGNEIHFGQPFE